jgi:hypothetical protein
MLDEDPSFIKAVMLSIGSTHAELKIFTPCVARVGQWLAA